MALLREINREVVRNFEGVKYFYSTVNESRSLTGNNWPYAGELILYSIAPAVLTFGLIEPLIEAPVRKFYSAIKKD
jgi:hypothetical protein